MKLQFQVSTIPTILEVIIRKKMFEEILPALFFYRK